jgi:hypothetical protein
MKPQTLAIIVLAGLLGAAAWAQTAVDVKEPTYENTTRIPHSITTPDRVETPAGTLEFFDGVPIGDTTQKVYDYVDRARAVEVFINMFPAVSMFNIRKGQRNLGHTRSNQIVIAEQMGDSKPLVLTWNNTSLYTWGFLDLKKDGPTVIEIPPDVLGILDDMYFRYISDMGAAGPDKGKGGKYLVLPPGYDGNVPDGYFVVQSRTYAVWNFMRGYVRDSVEAAAEEHQGEPQGLPAGAEGQPAADGVPQHVRSGGLPDHSAQRRQLLRGPRRHHPGGARRLHLPRDPGADRRHRHRQGQPFQPTGRMRRILGRGRGHRQRLRPRQYGVSA